MANSYTQIHLQLIFAVKFRASLINSSWKDELLKYITGIIQTQKHKLIIINGVADHLHVLIGFRPHQSLSELMQDIKGSSSKWINEKKFTPARLHGRKVTELFLTVIPI
jgi:REP element-mobilizing transposase RayT